MPLFLAGPFLWLGNLVFTVISYYGARKAILLAAFVVIIGLVGVATNELISNIDTLLGNALPTDLGLIAPFVPDNMSLCLSLIVSAHLACTAYRLAIKLIRWKASFLLA